MACLCRNFQIGTRTSGCSDRQKKEHIRFQNDITVHYSNDFAILKVLQERRRKEKPPKREGKIKVPVSNVGSDNLNAICATVWRSELGKCFKIQHTQSSGLDSGRQDFGLMAQNLDFHLATLYESPKRQTCLPKLFQ